MLQKNSLKALSRRDLLKSGVAAGATFVVGANFLTHASEAWAMETKALSPSSMATLVQVARDIYPHDRIADQYYAIAVKGHDDAAAEDEAKKQMFEDGIANLDSLAQGAGHPSYIAVGWEDDRVALLKQIEDTPMFQEVRGGLVVGLYNQPEVWPIFGYEGESFSKGGYLARGFDDIAWL
ncbi:MAG: hypothetical protein AAF530_08775 [Pseudomonadota bacterium]